MAACKRVVISALVEAALTKADGDFLSGGVTTRDEVERHLVPTLEAACGEKANALADVTARASSNATFFMILRTYTIVSPQLLRRSTSLRIVRI